MAVNKDLDQHILKRQAKLQDQDYNHLQQFEQINDNLTTIAEDKVKQITAKMPKIWIPLIIDLVIMCAMGTVLRFNGGKFWLMLILSAVILVVEYLLYTVWHKARLEKTYTEIANIKKNIAEIQKNFTPEYRTFNDKKLDLMDKIDGLVQSTSDGQEEYHILKSKNGDLLVRNIYDRGGFLHYQLVYKLTGELAQVREFSISRAGYLLTTYKDGQINERLFCGESGENFSLKKYNDFYNVPAKVNAEREKYANIISAKLQQIEKIKDGAPTGTYNWFEKLPISDKQAIDSLRQSEYIGRKRSGKKEDYKQKIAHDLSMDNLPGINVINNLFTSYNKEVNTLYKKIDILKQPDSSIYKAITDLQWYLRPVDVFTGSNKTDAYAKLSNSLAEAATDEEVIAKLSGEPGVTLLNDLVLPDIDGNLVKIDHVAITDAGVFLIEAKARTLEEGRIYRAKDEADKAGIRKQIALDKNVVLRQLKNETRGLFGDHLVEKVLRADAIRSLLVIVNRTNPAKQDFLIDNPNYYREYDRTLIVNPAELSHAIHRDTANLKLDEQGIERIVRALKNQARVYDQTHENYDFFPYLNKYSGPKLSQQIWNQLHNIEELEEVLAELNKSVDELVAFEKQCQKYSSLAAILPYFTTRLTDNELQLGGEVGLNMEQLSKIIADEDKLLTETKEKVDSFALEYSDNIKTLQSIEDGKLDAVVPIAVAVVISTLVGTLLM